MAVSTNAEEVAKFGIDTANMFGFWDWVGGRYSMDSAIGLSTMLAVGPDSFRAMLAGFHEMDEHFRTAPFEKNLPVLHGPAGLWYDNFFDAQTVAVLPYEQYLKRFPAYLQQLTMESNGKHVTLDGNRSRLPDRAGLLGRAGHQRPALLLPAHSSGNQADPLRLHRLRPFAQPAGPAPRFAAGQRLRPGRGAGVRQDARAEVKAEGTADWLVPHRTFEGNRPSNTILLDRLTPAALGKLVALYEHSVFTQGVDLGYRLVRPVGRRTGQGAGPAHHSRIGEQDEPEAETRQFDEYVDSPLSSAEGDRIMSVGFDKPLYILPFDHRGTFQKMFGWKGALTAEQTAEIAAAKQVIYDGFKAAIAGGVPRKRPAFWWTSSSAPPSLPTPPSTATTTSCPAEKSGQDEFDFEYGEDFGSISRSSIPTFCKVLVRYNPEGERR